MKTRFSTIYKIELIKLVKRKDWLAMLALIGISILFGAAILSDSYIGEADQSALYWACSQVCNSSMLFVSPLVVCFVTTRILGSEIESGSILLYTCKYRDRSRLYGAKSLALITFTLMLFLVMFLANIIIYYSLITQNGEVASGQFFGHNSLLLVIGILAIYISSFLIASQLSLVLSVYLKPNTVIGIMFGLILVAHNTYKLPLIQKINPWSYVTYMFSDVIATTQVVDKDINNLSFTFLVFLLLTVIYLIIFNLVGIKKLCSKDL